MFAAEDRGELPKGTAERWAEHTPDIKALPEHKMNKTAFEIADAVIEKISAWSDEETRAKRRANCPAAGNPKLQDERRKANREAGEKRRAVCVATRQNNKTAAEIADVVIEKIAMSDQEFEDAYLKHQTGMSKAEFDAEVARGQQGQLQGLKWGLPIGAGLGALGGLGFRQLTRASRPTLSIPRSVGGGALVGGAAGGLTGGLIGNFTYND